MWPLVITLVRRQLVTNSKTVSFWLQISEVQSILTHCRDQIVQVRKCQYSTLKSADKRVKRVHQVRGHGNHSLVESRKETQNNLTQTGLLAVIFDLTALVWAWESHKIKGPLYFFSLTPHFWVLTAHVTNNVVTMALMPGVWCLLCPAVRLILSDQQDVCVQSRIQDREHSGEENIAALGRRLSGEIIKRNISWHSRM